ERLTDEIEAAAGAVLKEVEAAGGAVTAIEKGVPQRWIAESAYRTEREIARGIQPKVGVNVYADEADADPSTPALFQLDEGTAERQIARTAKRVALRDERSHAAAIAALDAVAREGGNVMPPLLVAARAGATVGEMSGVFRSAFGEFREPNPW
ncbi:MAG: methylmalonyl-CoA mutase, N-terminal domain, partial [Actinomycetota bacterium]|nr:methylmalonyl-CoA mutase, N-terminal domain [Actinomycetota bacterium]